ncbi:MAG TPA: DUF1566 domain-containing protein [Rhodocyclaceae bacterium]|jgi:hypothetical protein|nr:DUF1566 domain-containing protein [Rhodocyclaceae bacterium]HRQ47127.1 DUF1566 domain-containing protein [Rhodocyclaceae bacterium]
MIKHLHSRRSLVLALFLCIAAVLLAGCSKREPITFTFERINADGSAYAGSGSYATDPWECVLDVRTSLMWEVKSAAPGLRHADNTYTWHFPPEADIYTRGDAGKPDGGSCNGSACDTWAFAKAVNEAGLCGYEDWRIPTKEELGSIVNPTIRPPGPTLEHSFFPNTSTAEYWTSSAYAYHSPGAWTWSFFNGLDRVDLKENAKHIRLVRGEAGTRPAPPRGPSK